MTISWAGLGAFEQDVSFGYVNRDVASPRQHNPRLVLNTPSESVLRTLRAELRRCTSFTFSVAFVSPRAIALLKQEFLEFEGVGRIITSDYLGFNSPQAFYELLNLQRLGFDVRLHKETAFHPKGYVFQTPEAINAVLGSSNLTENALATNHEWNLMVSATRDSDLFDQFSNLLDEQLTNSTPLTLDWVEDYARRYEPPPPRRTRAEVGDEPVSTPTIQPNSMQVDALVAIDAVRQAGAGRALVISATGTGKTILSALDVHQTTPERVLFVAHREQILDRAIDEFSRVLAAPRSEFGKLVGSTKQSDRKYVFATVQTLSRPDVFESLDPAAFDYILIDEVHRAGAASYSTVINYFTPRFLLGMTATPERSDDVSIFELFDFNVPYEIRLNRALELDMLAPFHYYGVTDITFADGLTTSDATPLSRLVAPERVDHVLRALDTYGQAGIAPRGLIFCSRNEEARLISDELNTRTLRGSPLKTAALSGSDSIEQRERMVEKLEAGELDYLLTVDIFNEGVDIPSINQVVMLRQTQSSIVFVQQLGRGLRKSAEKEYLVVLDFIGNYANNYLIPAALFGDDSLNKESLRRNLISSEEVGFLAGLSSVRFDRIAQERVLRSLTEAKLDSLHNLKAAIETVRNRVGRTPLLQDFLRFESADPILLATKLSSYPALLAKVHLESPNLSDEQLASLTVLSCELLTSKRPHELLLLRYLLDATAASHARISELFASQGLPASPEVTRSACRSLTLEFNTSAERTRYGDNAPALPEEEGIRIDPRVAQWYQESIEYRGQVDDLIVTGLAVIAARYDPSEPFTPSREYSRKDASRLLCWPSNSMGTIFGYQSDNETRTCPIFVTYRKSDDVSASTAYEDRLLDPSTLLWYSKGNRTLKSADVAAIASNSLELHVFVKMNDNDAADHYYLGRVHAEEPEETKMSNGTPVVRLHLNFEKQIDGALYDYFEPVVTEGSL
jgi:superfamily II DNA or RNA helicase